MESHNRHVWFTYVVASCPGWIVTAVVVVALVRSGSLPGWTAVLVVGAVIGTDLAAYPWMRRYYTPEPASRRLVSERGTSVSPLSPRGFVRVHGELWQATATDPQVSIPEGVEVRVCDVRGLELRVEAEGK